MTHPDVSAASGLGRAETPWIGHAHELLANHQIEMIMFLRWHTQGKNADMSRHAKMDDQRAMIKIDQQIFAAPAGTAYRMAAQGLRQRRRERPAWESPAIRLR